MAELRMADASFRRLNAAVTVVVCASVVGIAYWYERTHRRWSVRQHPLAAPRARLERTRTNYRERRALVAEVAQVSRFATEGHFARYAGTAPIPASSGNRHRQRFNRRGNRQLNSAIHRIGVTQLRIHEPAKDYVTRKRAEGKTKTEAIRALKRHITRVVFKTLISKEQPTDRLTAAAA